jgi:hypothetical protein
MNEYIVNIDDGEMPRMDLLRRHRHLIAWLDETKYPFTCVRAGEIIFENSVHAIECKLLFS